ncbi:MAG: 1-deoxy-D-xylulose-5-phosphate reductoisomerase [Pseudomonadota bacterium]|nr:1-deoxy-D-xylulose-5-phosphate reductoisomerase [Pseudomonadota bacterium]
MKHKQKRITILGSTGSVGCSTLDLIGSNSKEFSVHALTANNNVNLLAKQAKIFNAKIAAIANESLYPDLKDKLSGTGIETLCGGEGVIEAASSPVDFLMAAIVGSAGLEPTICAVRNGCTIGLANKECLVSAGDLFIQEVKNHNATLIPVDSEHSAIFQVFNFADLDSIKNVILTASGGPLLNFSKKQMKKVTPEVAVAHPNWDMGAKISVDSATMMNKGLEIIEAHHLFGMESKKIKVLIHPESIVHSCVSYVDGSVLAQMGVPDMRTPIAVSLAWPKRIKTNFEALDLGSLKSLTFRDPDLDTFPALNLARQTLDMGGFAPTVLNAANEVAVYEFLDKNISFLDIAKIVEKALEKVPSGSATNLTQIYEIDENTRERVLKETKPSIISKSTA